MPILFLSRWFPYPADNGSRIRISNLIKHLSSKHTVDLLSFASEPPSAERLAEARRGCRHVACALYHPFEPGRLAALAGFLSLKPRSVIDTFSSEMQALVHQAQAQNAYDLIIASEIDMIPYALSVPNVRQVCEDLELTVLYDDWQRQRHPLKRLRKGLTWCKTARYVADSLSRLDGCTVVSELERQRVLQVAPGYAPVKVIPNGIDPSAYAMSPTRPDPDTLIYSGSLTFPANWDAIEFFLNQVYPLVQAKRPGVRLLITGKLDGVPVDRLPRHAGVTFTGYLDDIQSAVAQSWASIVPLRIGGGTRLKILESLALGTPVVSTRKGAEGLDLIPERDILIADEPAEMASAITRVMGDAGLRERLSRHGRESVIIRYNWDTIGHELREFVDDIMREGCKTG